LGIRLIIIIGSQAIVEARFVFDPMTLYPLPYCLPGSNQYWKYQDRQVVEEPTWNVYW
jgi:hypothetical protein